MTGQPEQYITTADLLDEYGASLRGSWGDIDGRTEKSHLLCLSAAIREHGNEPLPASKVKRLRWDLDVCPRGEGHWTEFCGDGCGESAPW